MFKITTENPTVWKNIISMINTVNEECIMNVTKEYIELKCMPTDHASLIHFIWKSSEMKEFKCDVEQKIGFRLDEFNKVLGRAKNEFISVELTEKNTLKINIGDKKSYDLRLISTEHIEDPPAPKVLDGLTVTMPFPEFKEKIQDLAILGASFKVNIVNGKITFSSSIEAGNGESYYEDDSIKVSEPIEGEYSIYHMDKTLKSLSDIKDVKLCFGTKKPLKAIFIQPDMGDIAYYLAPIQER